MRHSLTKSSIHILFGTKDKLPLINEELKMILYPQIKYELEIEMKCPVRIINGTENHLHILFLQNPNLSLKDILKNIKGGSSHWINHNNFTEAKFSWQVGYGAFSVSESNVEKVYEYIFNQREHHKKISFTEEYNLLMRKHGLNYENC